MFARLRSRNTVFHVICSRHDNANRQALTEKVHLVLLRWFAIYFIWLLGFKYASTHILLIQFVGPFAKHALECVAW